MTFLFCNHFDVEERAGCFTLTIFLVSCDSQCLVAISPGAVGWSAVCDCVFPACTYLFFEAEMLNDVLEFF